MKHSRQIIPRRIGKGPVQVPGSKSYSHRMLIAAALSDGSCRITNCLRSQDTEFTMDALRRFGVGVRKQGTSVTIEGKSGRWRPCRDAIFLGNSGTSMRLVTALAAIGRDCYTITGSKRLQERPAGDLLHALGQIGAEARSIRDNGCPPLLVCGRNPEGGVVALNCAQSSQFLSAMLLIGPCLGRGIEIRVLDGPVSRPYVDLTVDVMQRFGIDLQRRGYTYFNIDGPQRYRSGDHAVEPDCSQAGYFWAASAISGRPLTVADISMQSSQGDIQLLHLFEKMGCRILQNHEGVSVAGRARRAIDADMADMPDMVPTLAVVAAFARGTTVIRNVGHLKTKESDRLEAVAHSLTKMKIDARATDDGLTIVGGRPQNAEIDPYDDHRIAMSFALAGLVVPGMVIKNAACVQKSFPDFWQVFERL